MNHPGATYYERLGVPPEASAEEIKRAYYRSVRHHPPERDPEGFRAVREAWETLGDPRTRRQYDTLLHHGGEVERLFTEAGKAHEAGDLAGEERLLRRLLVLDPENEPARVLLASCQLRQERFEDALKQLDRLARAPEPNPVHLYQAAQVRCRLADQVGEPRAPGLRQEAVDLFTRASALDPLNAEPLLGLARLHRSRGEYDPALEVIERAIAADGRVDFQDFEALHLACLIHLDREDFPGFDRTVARIQALAPGPEARGFVATRLAASALFAARGLAFEASVRLLQAARQFDPEAEGYGTLEDHYRELAAVLREWVALPEGDEVLRRLLLLEVLIAEADEGQKLQNLVDAWGEAVAQLSTLPPEVRQGWAAYLRERCPVFVRRNQDLVDQVEWEARAELGARAPVPSGAPAPEPPPAEVPAAPAPDPPPGAAASASGNPAPAQTPRFVHSITGDLIFGLLGALTVLAVLAFLWMSGL